MSESNAVEDWKKTFHSRPGARLGLVILIVLALLAAYLSEFSRQSSLLVFSLDLMLYLLYRAVLTEATAGKSVMGSIYLLLLVGCPFLPAFLEAWAQPEIFALCLVLGALVAVQLVALWKLEIKISDTSLFCRRFLRDPVIIHWKDVETVLCRVVNRTDKNGIAISTNARIMVASATKRIALSSLYSRIETGEVRAILDKAGPASVEWTLNALRENGEVPLGPVALCRKGFKVKGQLYCHIQVGKDALQLAEGNKKVRFAVDQLLNGQYLIEIMDRAKLSA